MNQSMGIKEVTLSGRSQNSSQEVNEPQKIIEEAFILFVRLFLQRQEKQDQTLETLKHLVSTLVIHTFVDRAQKEIDSEEHVRGNGLIADLLRLLVRGKDPSASSEIFDVLNHHKYFNDLSVGLRQAVLNGTLGLEDPLSKERRTQFQESACHYINREVADNEGRERLIFQVKNDPFQDLMRPNKQLQESQVDDPHEQIS